MKRFRNIFFCLTLALASIANVPMRPEEVEELLRSMNKPKVAHVLPMENDGGEPPLPEGFYFDDLPS